MQAQEGDHASMLWLYREALRLRREHPALGASGSAGPAGLTWLDLGAEVLAFTRPPDFTCVVNTGPAAVPLPAGRVLLSSVPLEHGRLPGDAAAWVAGG